MSQAFGLPNHKGRTLSAEHKRKVSEGVRKACTQEVRDKHSASLIGKPRPQEVRDKISKSHTGKIISEETREKMRKKIISPETRKKYSESHKGKSTGPCSKEKREKIRQSNLGLKSHGKYITPWGEFDSAGMASRFNNLISEDSARCWCKNSNKKVSKIAIIKSNYLQEHMLDMTYNEIGFSFIKNE